LFSQNVTGIWKGHFTTDNGEQYRLEFQIKQNSDGSFSASGVSYSWQDDIRFYGKATMTGSYVKTSKNWRIREIKTVELKNPGGLTCIMNYNLAFSKSGREEFLQGTYLGKYEIKGKPNPSVWGDCGGGTVFLRRVQSSDFYVEPFLRKKPLVTPTPRNNVPVKKDTIVAKKPATTSPRKTPVVRKPIPVKPRTTAPNARQQTDSSTKINSPVVKIIPKPQVTTPAVLKQRSNELMKSLVVNDSKVVVKLYDNGEIDDDTISVFYDKKLIVSNKRLSTAPITINLDMDEEDVVHELVMVAENLGRIPPNTSLMIVEAGDQRFDVRITSTEQKNALVRFRFEKTKKP
jgi:hypothetical protein